MEELADLIPDYFHHIGELIYRAQSLSLYKEVYLQSGFFIYKVHRMQRTIIQGYPHTTKAAYCVGHSAPSTSLVANSPSTLWVGGPLHTGMYAKPSPPLYHVHRKPSLPLHHEHRQVAPFTAVPCSQVAPSSVAVCSLGIVG